MSYTWMEVLVLLLLNPVNTACLSDTVLEFDH